MKHVLLIGCALLSASVGVLILVLSKCATNVAILAGSGFVLLTIVLAIPAQFAQAKDALAALVVAIKGALAPAKHD